MARLHREIVDVVLGRIIDGQYAAAVLLPKEEALQEEFGIARGTVREALRALEERGVVSVKHGRGATVRPPETWNVLDPIVARALAGSRKRRAFLAQLAEYQALLESEAAALAASRASATERAAVRAAADDLEEAADVVGRVRQVRRLVAEAAHNLPLAAALRALSDAHEVRLRGDAVGDYARMAMAVADGDATTARQAAQAVASAT